MGKFWGDYRGGVGKSSVLKHKSGNISETRKDREKVSYYGGPEHFQGTHTLGAPRGHLRDSSARLSC